MFRTKCYILEEHNEAFIVWALALRSSIISEESHVLLHFDDHSDMSVSRYNQSIYGLLEKEPNDIIEFAYKEMGIASFIIPAIFMKIINEVYWIKQDGRKSRTVNRYLTSFNDDGKHLCFVSKEKKGINRDWVMFKYRKSNEDEFRAGMYKDKKILLDIDLDYFSTITLPQSENEVVIEITEDEYNDFLSNRYHPLNFLVNKLDVLKENGSYFFIINYYKDIYPSSRKVDVEVIKKRVQNFIISLKLMNIAPELITICRSRHSGYTPSDQWKFIEQELMKGLSNLYELDSEYITSLVTYKSID